MVAVNEGGEVVNVQDRIDDEPMTPEKRAAVTRWYTESLNNSMESAEKVPFVEIVRLSMIQVLAVGEEITLPDGSRGRVMSVDGRNVSVQMEGVLTSVTANVRIDDDRTDAMFFTIDGRTETIPVSRPRPDHELRILRQLDLARLHRVTAEDLRERARVRALSDSALPLDAPSGGLCKGRYRATRSQVCDDTRMRCRGALGLYAFAPQGRFVNPPVFLHGVCGYGFIGSAAAESPWCIAPSIGREAR